MYIPKSMKNKIAKAFYDKEVYLIDKREIMDAEGGINATSYDIKETFKGNVNFSNCKQIQEEYGLDYEIDVSITTNYDSLKHNDLIEYLNIKYVVTDILSNDSHKLIVAKKWHK